MKKLAVALCLLVIASSALASTDILKIKKIVGQPGYTPRWFHIQDHVITEVFAPTSDDWFMVGAGPSFTVSGISVSMPFGFTFAPKDEFSIIGHSASVLLTRKVGSFKFYSLDVFNLERDFSFSNYFGKQYVFFTMEKCAIGPELLIRASSESVSYTPGVALDYKFSKKTSVELFYGESQEGPMIKIDFSQLFF